MAVPQEDLLRDQLADRTHLLQQLMQRAGLSTFKALSQASGLSEKQLRQVRRGFLTQMRLDLLLNLSQALQIDLATLLVQMGKDKGQVALLLQPQAQQNATVEQGATNQELGAAVQLELPDKVAETGHDVQQLRQEYDRLLTQLQEQRDHLLQEFQQSILQTLESLLLQLPTAAYAAQQNPQAPAVQLLPLLQPLDRLLQEWGIEAIAAVGAEIDYDPRWHQLMDGMAEAGDRVRVRYVGYRQGDKLLYRAKVIPLQHGE